ncbi:MAG: hypothetical protein GXX96_08975 [Planctomycetaceae bacterium]|nr:hypothetical protein [Planctomycetaceae bacterium]
MYNIFDSACSALGHTLLALAAGVAVMVLVALVAERLLAGAAARRVLWQAVAVGMGILLAFELTGMGSAVSAFSFLSNDRREVVSSAQADTRPMATDPSGMPATADRLPDMDGMGECSSNELWEPAWVEVPCDSLPSLAEDDVAETGKFFAGPPSVDEQLCKTAGMPVSPCGEHSLATAEDGADATEPIGSAVARDRLPASVVWFLAAAWLVGGGWCLGRTLVARTKLQRLQRQWQQLDAPDVVELIGELGPRIGVSRSVRVLAVEGIPAPVAFGMLRPAVLVPADFAGRFSRSQQQVILAHELAHLAASDPAWLLASELTTALFWWHPAAHLAHRRLLAASEQAADEASLLVPGGPDVLADCLVKLGRRLSGRPRFGWVAAEGSGLRSGLARRVQRLLKLGDRPTPLKAERIPVAVKPIAVLLLLVLTISCTLWAHPKASFAKGEESMNVLTMSWRQSLAAATLTAFLTPLAGQAADDAPPTPPKPAQLEEGSPADQLLVVQRGERENREAEVRGDRERGEREGRGDRERGPRDRDVEHREQGERERGERPEGRVDELRRRVEELEREKAECREQMERGVREVEEVTRKTQEEREGNIRHIAELEGQLAKLKQELKEEAEEEENEEEGKKELEELEKDIGRVSEELEKAREVRTELSKRAEDTRRATAEQRQNLVRRLAALERELAEVRGQLGRLVPPRDGDRAGPPPELQVRIDHLRIALENLHAAGLHDQAEQIGQQIERLVGKFTPGPPEGRGPEAPPRGPRPEGRPEPGGEIIGRLRGEVEQLRRENEEIRRMMREIREAQERLMNELRERR